MHCHFNFLSCTADALGFPDAVVKPQWWSWGHEGVPGRQQWGAVLQLPCWDPQPQNRAVCTNCFTLKPSSCQVRQEGNAEIELCYSSLHALSCLPAPASNSKPRTPQFCNNKPSLQGWFLPSQEHMAALRIAGFLSTSNEWLQDGLLRSEGEQVVYHASEQQSGLTHWFLMKRNGVFPGPCWAEDAAAPAFGGSFFSSCCCSGSPCTATPTPWGGMAPQHPLPFSLSVYELLCPQGRWAAWQQHQSPQTQTLGEVFYKHHTIFYKM